MTSAGPGAGRVVVLVGTDADALGAVARELEDAGSRAAVFVGDVTDAAGKAALIEMLDELFPPSLPSPNLRQRNMK